MSNICLWQYGLYSTTSEDNQPPEDHPTSNQEPSDEKNSTSQRATMACKEEITLLCDLQGTLIGSIDLIELCKVNKDNKDARGADTDVVTIPYSLRATWKAIFAQRVIEELVVGHLRFEDLQRLFIADEKFLISRLTHNGAAKTCGRATTFRQKMTTSIAENTTFRVSLRLLLANMAALGLLYRKNLTLSNRFGPAAASVQNPPATLAQPPVPPPQLQTNWTFA
jgi:hypothetical protein